MRDEMRSRAVVELVVMHGVAMTANWRCIARFSEPHESPH